MKKGNRTMKKTLTALLRRAKSEAFSLFPFSLREGNKHQVCGYLSPSNPFISQNELEELFAYGHATRVDPKEIELSSDFEPEKWVAGWIGHVFLSEAHAQGIPLPNPGVAKSYDIGEGRVWFAPHQVVYETLHEWVQQSALIAFCDADKEKARACAKLMRRTFPGAPETRAAILHVQKSAKAKKAKLKWYTKLENDNGKPTTEQDLLRRFELILRRYQEKEKIASNPGPS